MSAYMIYTKYIAHGHRQVESLFKMTLVYVNTYIYIYILPCDPISPRKSDSTPVHYEQ